MIEFGGSNIGWPWHGIYRASTAKLTTHGGDIDLPGAAPIDGDCYLVQIPGLATPTTSAEEVTEGKTWTNYALIYGGRLYGKDMAGGIIYVDSANRPWRISITRGGTRTQKEIRVTVAAQRFGEVAAGTAPTVTLAQMTVAFNTHADYPSSFTGNNLIAQIIDVAKNGQKFLVGVPRYRGYAAVAEVTLSGSPADGTFSSSIELLADESTADDWSNLYAETSSGRYYIGIWREFDWAAPASPYPSGNLPTSPAFYYDINGVLTAFDGTSYSTHANYSLRMQTGGAQPDSVTTFGDGYLSSVFTYRPIDIVRAEIRWLCGARYSAEWVAEAVVMTVNTRVDYDEPSFDDTPVYLAHTDPLPAFGPIASSATCVVKSDVIAGGASVDASEQVVTTETSGDDSYVMSLSRNGVFVSSVSYSAPAGSGYSYGRFGGNINPAFLVTSTLSENAGIGARRASNSIYQYVVPTLNIYASDVSPIVLGTNKLSGPYVGRLSAVDYSAFYASEHPITGEIAQGDNVVCWV